MGNYDVIVKTEEIRKKVEEGDYESAQKILDTLVLKKIKNISDLNLFAQVYEQNERYEEAAVLYHKVYEKLKTRKTISQIIDISIRMGNTEEAEKYLIQYKKASPEDFDSLIYRYKIEKLKGASYEQLIDILIALKKMEYNEQWAYELAKVYYKAGMEEECVKECSDIILWFGEGTFVEKAKMLRSYYSGETDREKLMEELKQRTKQTFNPSVSDDLQEKAQDEYTMEISESDSFTGNEIEELEADLKNNVQDMLIQEEESDIDSGIQMHTEKQEISDFDAEEDLEPDIETDFEPDAEVDSEPDIEADFEPDSEEEFDSEDDVEAKFGAEAEFTVDVELDAESKEEPQEAVADEHDIALRQMEEKYKINIEEIFENFLHVNGVKKQIVKSIELILQDNKNPVIMIITGTKGTGKTTLAKDFALLFGKANKIKSSKVAKISAEKLNTVDLQAKKETLRSCCMVVENASDLKRETIENLLELIKCLQGDIAIIFEEDKKNMNRLFRECPRLMDLLKVRIHLPQYTEEDMMGFALACLKQKGYRLNADSKSALENCLKQIVKQANPHTMLMQIYQIMQSVMNAADIRTGKQLTDLAAKGRLTDVGILYILPQDFKC